MEHINNGVGNYTEVETITQASIGEDAKRLIQELDQKKYLHNEISGAQIVKEGATQMDWLIKDLIPRTGMGAVAGGSDLGKSALLRQLGIVVTTNSNDFLGFEMNPVHNSAIIVTTEDDRPAVSYLLKRQTHGIDSESLENIRFVFEYENLLDELNAMLINNPADIVILDCFADVYGGDLKDTQKIRTFLSPFQQLSANHSCFIMFLHHTGKRTENFEPSKNNLLSGQGLEAKLRLVMELRADPMNVDHRHLCIVKGNYLPGRMKRESFVLHFNEQTFWFSNTEGRTPFEFLVKTQEDSSKAKYEQAKQMKENGYSYEKIAEALGYGSKGTVSKLFERAEKNGWNK